MCCVICVVIFFLFILALYVMCNLIMYVVFSNMGNWIIAVSASRERLFIRLLCL